MKKFTVSEVRNWKRAYKGTGAAEIFDAYADRLEADEKAVPVMVVNHVSSAEHDLPIGMKLYAHPSPSAAERLAEALRVTDEMVERACKKYAFREDGAIFPDAYSDEEVLAERVLMREFLEHVLSSAHSAQAQPPAASVPDAETLRLHLGELTPDEVCVAKAAYRGWPMLERAP